MTSVPPPRAPSGVLPDDDKATVGGEPRLKAGVGLTGVVMLGAGTAIGVSIFSVLAPAAQVAGSGLLVAIGLASVPMIVFAVIYSFMASVAPASGASFEWPTRFISPLAGFMIAWLRILGSVAVMVTLTTVFTNYLNALLPLHPIVTGITLLTLVFSINIVGISVAARAQTAMMLVLLAALALYVLTGLPLASSSRFSDPFVGGWAPIFAAVPLMITLFLGIEAATEIGEEVRDARRTIPRGIVLAILLTASVYLIVCLTTLGLLGPEQLAQSPAPLLDAARKPLGALAVPVILGAASISALKTLNSSFLIFSRYLFAMGRNGVLPTGLGAVHARWGTPYVACITAYACALAGLLMPSSLVFLLLAVNIPTMLKYMSTCICAVRIVDRSELPWQDSALGFGGSFVRRFGYLGALFAAVVIVAGLKADWRPYVLVAVWGAAGFLYWTVRKRFTLARVRA